MTSILLRFTWFKFDYDNNRYRYRRCLFFLPKNGRVGLIAEISPDTWGKRAESNVKDSNNILGLHRQTSPIPRICGREQEKESLCPNRTKRLFFWELDGNLCLLHLKSAQYFIALISLVYIGTKTGYLWVCLARPISHPFFQREPFWFPGLCHRPNPYQKKT